jgi:UDP-N-acetylmuramoyl-tripeptide--D-alanyl-D-alanine ligase
MNILFVVTSILFFLWVTRSILFWVRISQQNDYRIDRILVFIKQRRTKGFDLVLFLFKWLLFFGYVLIIFFDNFYFVFQILITLLYLLQTQILFKETFAVNFHKYKATVRSASIVVISFVFITAIYIFPLLDSFYWLLLLDILVPFIVLFLVFIFSFPMELYSDWRVEQAQKKIQNYPNLIVIAVSGSHGKTATKDYIAKILQKRFNVITKKGKVHNELDIANTIQFKLKYDTDILITELIAYNTHEITSSCKILHPLIGVITAIGEVDSYKAKNVKKIRSINFELVESLPKNGLCLFNGNSVDAYSLYKKTKMKKCLYLNSIAANITTSKNDIIVIKMSKKKMYTSFEAQVLNAIIHFRVSSQVNIDLILPGILIGKYLGMTKEELKKAVSELT